MELEKSARTPSNDLRTTTLSEEQFWDVLQSAISFLKHRAVGNVHLEFGKKKTLNRAIPVQELEKTIVDGLQAGTIEWKAKSNFTFTAKSLPLSTTIRNDGGMQFKSTDPTLIRKIFDILEFRGIKIID